MSKPFIHAQNSAKKWGGKASDYIEIHNLLDSSKGAVPDSRHRCLTHNSWFLSNILEKIFGYTITNSDNKEVSVRDIGELHIMEDFDHKFIPTAQDWLVNIEVQEWMNNGKGEMPSSRNIENKKAVVDWFETLPIFDDKMVDVRIKPFRTPGYITPQTYD
jgi:hypothetical protein